MAKVKVGLIYGGRSGEHEISILSANSVISAIDRQKYEVYPIGITKEGAWIPGQSPSALVESKELRVRRLAVDRGEVPGGASVAGDNNSLMALENKRGQILSGLREKVDLVFPVMHGPFGEDGTIQGLLELAGIPYVGGGVLGSAVGMDKAMMKAVFLQHGLPVGDYLAILRRDWEANPGQIMDRIEQRLGYPCFVKPANLGSSVGISKAHHREELQKALDLAALYDRRLVVEKMLAGREIECGVLGNDEPKASVLGEIVPCAEFYDYEAKYVLNNSKLIIPADLPEEITRQVQGLAIRAFKAIDGAGLGRVDFFVDPERGQVFVNEINTMPGFTRISMYPKLWEASGISYPELIDRLIQLAFERHRDKSRNKIK
ncbi:MAG: D-alanine--D-alanine ligase [Firmicutes bacterium]|nr:D-alanine--D-alanine ligase [Bacillota bacterium]